MRFQIRAGAAVLTAAASIAVALLAAPTTAQAADSRCPAWKVCLFEKPNFQGGRMELGYDPINGWQDCELYLGDNWFNNGNAVDNHASSIINNSGIPKTAYQAAQWPSRSANWQFPVSGTAVMPDLTSVRARWGSSGEYSYRNLDNQVSGVC